jgi:hypothetical protein
MIQEFVDRFMRNQDELRRRFSSTPPDIYYDVVRHVVEVVRDENKYDTLDPERIHTIDDGDYQGTLLFVIAASGYQPYQYWYVKVSYGSCSGCDTLESIRNYEYNQPPTEKQVDDYMTLALHIVQGLKEME